MDDEMVLSEVEGYFSIKQAAGILGVSYKTVHEYVTEGRLQAKRLGGAIAIPAEAVKNFKPNISGRVRTTFPKWRIAYDDNVLLQTSIFVQLRKGKQNAFNKLLDEIRTKNKHPLPGTVARYVTMSRGQPGLVQITLIWRSSVMPDEVARQVALEAFQQSLADVLDWSTARYDDGDVVMHA